ncbi:hypothetical protein JYT90_01110 [bacterium AH-315-P07]|nr:hypothetical protein [bacterium AH-315-P07]
MVKPLDTELRHKYQVESRKKQDRRRMQVDMSLVDRLKAECRGREWWLRVPFAVILVWSFISYIVTPNDVVVLDWISIIMHKIGHVLWGVVLGDNAGFLGGIIFQLIIPIATIEICRRKSTPFYMSIACGWLSANILWLSKYAEGTPDKSYPAGLNNEAAHDWYYLLEPLNSIELASGIAQGLYISGMLAMAACLYICGYQIYFMLRLEERRIGSRRSVRSATEGRVDSYEVANWRER